MKKTSVHAIALFNLLFLTTTPNLVAATGEEVVHQASTNCNDTSLQDCRYLDIRSELTIIKLSPQVRRQQYLKKEGINSNELMPFISGSDQIR